MKIVPTVGRVIWFYESNNQVEPKAAIVAKVWSDEVVNVMVVEENGTTKPATSVRLFQENEIPNITPYAKWMPYQIGQAKKAAE